MASRDTSASPTIVFAAGGTGGHIYPALAVARAIRTQRADAEIAFLCSARAIDERVMSGTSEAWTPTNAKPFGVRPKTLIRFVWNWGRSLRTCRAALKGADALVVTGGFVSAPAARAAKIEGVPIVLLNLDAVPGKASRLVARTAAIKCSASHSEQTPSDWERIPPVVRAELMTPREAASCRSACGLDPATKTLLITGGSQGARSLNEAVLHCLSNAPELFDGWQALHQAGVGEEMIERLTEAYKESGVRAHVTPFIEKMDIAWHASDLALARAGAGAVGEAWATRTPTAFLPYPFHADDHQTVNARPLVKAGSAAVVRDHNDAPETCEELIPLLRSLMTQDAPLKAMREATGTLGPANGAELVASRVFDLIGTPAH